MSEPVVVPGDVDSEGNVHLDIPRRQHQALLKARFAEKRVDVEVRERKSRRSDRQNRAFWASITPWAQELGYTPEELKYELLGAMWGFKEVKGKLTGDVRLVPIRPNTSKLNTKDFCDLMEFAVIKAAETGYVMLLPDEFKEQKRKQH